MNTRCGLIGDASTAARLASVSHHFANGDDRLMIALGVVQPSQQVYGSRPRRRKTDADLPAELGMAATHEGGRLLVPRLDELNLVPGTVERADDAVDAIAGITVDATHAPFQQTRDKRIGYGLAHQVALS